MAKKRSLLYSCLSVPIGCALFGFIGWAVIGGAANWLKNRPPPPPKPAEQIAAEKVRHEEAQVYVLTRDVVKSQLKYPDDSSFIGSQQTNRVGNTIVISGKVKAPNTLGANLTHPYQASWTFADEKPKLLSLVVGGETLYKDAGN